jgi:hypothetical protein
VRTTEDPDRVPGQQHAAEPISVGWWIVTVHRRQGLCVHVRREKSELLFECVEVTQGRSVQCVEVTLDEVARAQRPASDVLRWYLECVCRVVADRRRRDIDRGWLIRRVLPAILQASSRLGVYA